MLSDSKFSGIESMLPKNETQVWTPILREYKLSEWDSFLDNSVIVRNPDPIARRMMVFEIRKAILTKGKLPVLEGIDKVCHVFSCFPSRLRSSLWG